MNKLVAVVTVSAVSQGEGEESTYWTTFYEGGVQQGQLHLSGDGTSVLLQALRAANITVVDLSPNPDLDAEEIVL